MAEVGDGQEVVLGLLEQLADGVDLGPLRGSCGARSDRVEVLDRQVEVRRTAGGGRDLTGSRPLGLIGHVGDEAHERAQGVAGRGQRFPAA